MNDEPAVWYFVGLWVIFNILLVTIIEVLK